MRKHILVMAALALFIGGAAPVLAYGELSGPINDFLIIIDGKTKNIELSVVPLAFSRERAEELVKNSGGAHSSTGVYASGGPFSGDGAVGRIIGRGKCTLPPNSSIGAFRNTSLDFVTGIIFEFESSRKRNSKLVTKNDELKKDGTYVAVIERTTLGYHH